MLRTPFQYNGERKSKSIALLKHQSRKVLLKASLLYPCFSVWCDIVAEREKKGQNVSSVAMYDWTLVLESKNYPYRVIHKKNSMSIEVPFSLALKALDEIKEFERESVTPPVYIYPKRSFVPLILVLWSILCLHGLRNGWFIFHLPTAHFPDSSLWPETFGLDMYKTIYFGEWWRSVTALAVHKNDLHLASNLIFGFIFIGLLCRRAGNGITFLSLLFASAFANICNAFFRYSSAITISIGFSTSVFASIGILTVFSCLDIFYRKKKKTYTVYPRTNFFLFPFGAGLALLAQLGGGAQENTDIAAHVWGFFIGFLVGGLFWLLEKYIIKFCENKQKRIQSFLGISALCFVIVCWGIGTKIL